MVLQVKLNIVPATTFSLSIYSITGASVFACGNLYSLIMFGHYYILLKRNLSETSAPFKCIVPSQLSTNYLNCFMKSWIWIRK